MDIRWLLVVAFVFLLIERTLFRRMAMRHLEYRRTFSNTVVPAGEQVQLVEVIDNRKWLPVPWVVLEATFDVNLAFESKTDLNVRESQRYQNHRSYFSLRPNTRITRKHSIRCMKRGVYRIDTAAMTCGDIFGLQTSVKEWSLRGSGTELTVLPLIRDVSSINIPAQSWQGDAVVRRWILADPFMKSGTRPYEPGDTLSQVNWKATARVGALQVHRQEFTADYRVQILLNFEVMENMWGHVTEPERLEAGIVLAASIAERFIRQGMPVGFACNGFRFDGDPSDWIEPAAGEGHLEALLRAMAELDLRVSMGFSDLLETQVHRRLVHTDYVIITGYVNDRMEQPMDALRHNGHAVEVLDLPRAEEAVTWTTVSDTQSGVRVYAG